MAGRVRDFTLGTKKKLLSYIENNDNGWSQIGDWFGDRWLDICSAFHGVQLQDDMSNVESYHREIIDKNNTSKEDIKNIFTKVYSIEDNYAALFRQNTKLLSSYQSIVTKLQDCIGDSNFATSFDRNAWQLKMADDYTKLTQMHWEEIMNKKPEDITDAEYQKVAYLLLTTKDPKIIEEILNKCYVQDTAFPVNDEDPTNTTMWVKSPKLKKIYAAMQAMTLALIYDASNASDEKVTKLINNEVIETAEQRSQLLLTFLKNNDPVLTYLYSGVKPNISVNMVESDYMITYNTLGDRYHDMSKETVTIHSCKESDAAQKATEEECNNYISSHFGLQEQDITNSLNSAAVKCGSGKVVDAFINIIPGSNYAKATKDVVDIAAEPLTKAKNVADFQKISNIGDMGSVVNLFNLKYISSDINNDSSRHCFSLYPTIKDPSFPDSKSTVECLKNFNDHLLNDPRYAQYSKDIDYTKDNKLTMDDLLNNPTKTTKLINELYHDSESKGIPFRKLVENSYSCQ